MRRDFNSLKERPLPATDPPSTPAGRRALVQIVRKLEAWFVRNQRTLPWRGTYDPYQVWLSEVMLQQTRMSVVLPYFSRFLGRFPTIRDLAAADEQDVLAAWSGLGYYRRARMLLAGARHVVGNHGGELPNQRQAIDDIPGVGRYTSGAILSIAFNQREPIVDGNVARVLARLEALESPAGSRELAAAEWLIADGMVKRSDSPRNFNQALMELGATICTPRHPDCDGCPVSAECRAWQMRAVEEFPRPKAPKASISLEIPLFILCDGQRILLRKESGPLMDGMYHLPHGNDHLLEATKGIEPGRVLGKFRHTVTHRRIEFHLFEGQASGRIAEGPGEFVWIDPQDLAALPHPSYVAKAIRMWEKR